MGLFQDLQDEQQRIVIAKLTGQPLDFSRLREIATEFNKQSDAIRPTTEEKAFLLALYEMTRLICINKYGADRSFSI